MRDLLHIGAACVVLLVSGCGARSALEVGADTGADDAGVDAGSPCGPPGPERCNGADDDCDGAVDEGLGFGAVRPRTVVRSDQGSTGDCTSCRWAAGTQLWVHGDGLLAVWRMGFDGVRPQPNAWARRLADDLSPRGEPFVLFDTNVPNGFRLAPIDDAVAALAFCGRFGADEMGSAFIAPDGEVRVAPARRPPEGFGCGALHPDVAWSGERALFAWTNNRGLIDTRAVLLDVTDRGGRSVDARAVSEAGGDLSVPPRFAVGHGAVAMVTGHQPELRVTQLRFVLLDPRGRERTRLDLDAPPETRWGITDVVATRDGWLVVGTDRTSFDEPVGRALVRLDPAGAVVEGPRSVEPGWEWSRVELEPRPNGELLLAGGLESPDGVNGLAVMRLDAAGRRIDVWRPDPVEGLGLSGFDLVVAGSRVFFIYPGPAEDSEPNEVVLWELGCVP